MYRKMQILTSNASMNIAQVLKISTKIYEPRTSIRINIVIKRPFRIIRKPRNYQAQCPMLCVCRNHKSCPIPAQYIYINIC